ncbi:preprotein translocase subunit YajC, partial [Mycolicibacterium hippocampi]|uniref:preprotein translocase subunit YajC n=1 Tax=Mycolicibacterium hippocampi TaxID=659824 RepID=UPI0021F348C5
DENVDLEIAPGVVTTWMKLAIRDRIEPETAADLEIAPGVVTTWMKLAIRDRIEPETAASAAELSDSDAERLTKD